VIRAPNIAVYTGHHEVEQGVGLDESCKPLDFYFAFYWSRIEKIKKQTIYHTNSS
jgi:hypothetical protein